MLVDDCPHTFAELAATVLSQHMLRLRVSLKNPHAASLFAKQGEGPVAIGRTLEEFGRVPFWQSSRTAKGRQRAGGAPENVRESQACNCSFARGS